MNRNNLSWVDNKVLNPSSTQRPSQNTPPMRPFMDTMPAQYQEPSTGPAPTGLSPATYQSPMTNTPTQTGVSPATYQSPMSNTPTQTGVSPATYQSPMSNTPNQMGVSPAQYQEPAAKAPSPTGLSPAQYQEPATKTPAPTGLSPATYQDPAATIPFSGLPGAGMGPSAQAQTRDEAYAPGSPLFQQGPPTLSNPGYVPAYLRTQIGKRVRAEFAISSSIYTDRSGILREVGINYFILEDLISHAMIMCDLYSLKFLTSL